MCIRDRSISALNIAGAAMVIVGVVLYARADSKEEKPGDPMSGDQWTPDAPGNLPPLGGE